MGIEDCKDVKDYMSYCNVTSVEDLTDEQVLSWARIGRMGLKTKISVKIVEFGIFGKIPNREKAIKLLKQAMEENKVFSCSYIVQESCDGPNNTKDNYEYFSMRVK